MEKLRRRLAELVDLASLEMLASWDQLVMMPGEGAAGRGHVLGTLARITHERATAEEIGEWLSSLEEVPLEMRRGPRAIAARHLELRQLEQRIRLAW